METTTKELLARRDKLLGPAYRLFYDESVYLVRGNGLFLALELVSDREQRTPDGGPARSVVNGLRDRGVLTGVIDPDRNILKLRPPMVISRVDAAVMLERLDDVLKAGSSHP